MLLSADSRIQPMNQFRHIANRIASMLGVGRITAMKDAGGTQSVQYQTPLEVASAHRLAEFGFSSGCLSARMCWRSWVVIVQIPVVIATNHQGYAIPIFSPGETVVYNQWGMNILLTENGIFIDAKGKMLRSTMQPLSPSMPVKASWPTRHY
jgi:phage gp45-like